MLPSIVATDLDGTLLRSDRSVSERTRSTLIAAGEAGLTVVVVTARPPRWLGDIAGLHLHGYAICANGAVLVDLDSGDHLDTSPIDRDAILAACAAIRGQMDGVAFGIEYSHASGHEPDYRSDWPRLPGTHLGPIEELVAVPDHPLKVLVRLDGLGADSVEPVQRLVGDAVDVSYSGSEGILEIGPPGIDKGSALARFVTGRGLGPEHVVAVGDMPNDLPMLAWAGSAATVANAHPDVLAAADTVLPSNDDDGVAHLIESLLAQGS